MPIITIQRRMRELGRIRTGVQVPGRKLGSRRPEKLETFRLTSDNEALIAAAAEAYGGEVKPWAAPTGPEFEVITKASAIDVIVPPGQAVSQWYELWSGAGCARRCDGEREVLTMTPCICERESPDLAARIDRAGKGEACKPTTRVNLILPQIPDLGVWRLESHGYYAAVELAGIAELLEAATSAGQLLPARLRIDQREKREPGKPVSKYTVPVLESPLIQVDRLIAAGVVSVIGAGDDVKQVGPGPAAASRPALPPGSALPPTSDFRAPTPAEPPDEPFFADAAATKVAPLDQATFMQRIGGTAGVTHQLVVEAAQALFGEGKTLRSLTDDDRGQLWAEVERRLSTREGVTA